MNPVLLWSDPDTHQSSYVIEGGMLPVPNADRGVAVGIEMAPPRAPRRRAALRALHGHGARRAASRRVHEVERRGVRALTIDRYFVAAGPRRSIARAPDRMFRRP